MTNVMYIEVQASDETVIHTEYRKFKPRAERLVCRLFNRVTIEMLHKYPDCKRVQVVRKEITP